MKALFCTALIILSCIIIIYILKDSEESYIANGFTRKIRNTEIWLKDSREFPNANLSFVGRIDSQILFISYKNKLHVYQTKFDLLKVDTLVVNFPDQFNKQAFNIFHNSFDSHIYSNNLYGNWSVSNSQQTSFYHVSDLFSDRFEILDPSIVVARIREVKGKEKTISLARLNLQKEQPLEKKFQLPYQKNGVFSNDGLLSYSSVQKRLVYMYFYRGEFMILDSALNMLYLSKTIDTVRQVEIRTKTVNIRGKGGERHIQSIPIDPPKFVNIYITTNEDRLYLVSKLKGDNEKKQDFKTHTVVDVYSLRDGNYMYSFYIPMYKEKRLNEFQINGDLMVAIYGTDLVTYNFSE